MILVSGMLLASLGIVLFLVGRPDRKGALQRLETQIPYPILFVHGFGGTGEGWVDAGLTDYLEQTGLRFGGVVHTTIEGGVHLEDSHFPPESSDFYALDISDPFQSLELWQREIHAAADRILSWTGASRLVLVGFSAGGVAARKYLVEHSEDHRIAKLVTIASPHLGSELALVSRVDRDVRKAIDDGRLSGKMAEKYNSIIARIQKVTELRLDAPLLRELVPPDHDGAFLEELNRSPHPTDVEYSCLITTGSLLDLDSKKLQAEVASLRGFVFDRSIISEKLLTLLMGLTAGDSGLASGGGDGVVLAASQNLARVEFFRRNPQLLKKVDSIPSSHFSAKSRYRAIVKAIADPPAIFDMELSEDFRLRYDAIDYLALLSQIEVRDPEGRPIQVSGPEIWRRGSRGFVRRSIGPLTELRPACLEILVRIPGESMPFGERLILDTQKTSDGSGCRESVVSHSGKVDFRLRKIWGHSNLRADLLDGAPELLAVLFVDGVEVSRSPDTRHPPDPFSANWRTELRYEPGSSRIRLELWDLDVGVPQTLGTIVWNPGRLRLGRSVAITDSGIGVELEILTIGSDRVVWSEEALYLENRPDLKRADS